MQTSESARYRLSLDSYVVMSAAVVYMATPKAACTSFKHLMATLAGVDIGNLAQSLLPAKTKELAVHDRSLLKLPSLLDVSDAVRTQVLTSQEFLRFCVVRNPFRRLASAWLDRILCHSLSPIAPIMQYLEFP